MAWIKLSSSGVGASTDRDSGEYLLGHLGAEHGNSATDMGRS